MSDEKIIAVVGATGAQGGGLARAILDDPDGGFAVRALTRSPDGENARALADAGAEVVRADLDDPESVKAAFAGAYGAFCLTNFWEHFSPEKEKEQARTMAEAAAATGLRHVIWSTLEDTRELLPVDNDEMPTLMERYNVPHFDAKGESDAFFREAGVPTTFLLTAFYWDNIIHFGMAPQRGEDGVLRFALPIADAKMPSIAVGDIGACAYGVLKRGDRHIGEYVGIAGGHLSGQEMADGLAKAVGEPVQYVSPDFDTYRSFDFPGADDLGNMFQYKVLFEDEFRAARPVEEARKLHPHLMSFEEWVAANAEAIEAQ